VAAVLCETMEIGAALRLALWVASQGGEGSQHIPSALGDAAGFLRSEHLRAPRIPMWSEQSGTWITDAQATDSRFWIASAQQRMHPECGGLEQDLQAAHHRLVEVGLIPLPELYLEKVLGGRLLSRSSRLPQLQAGDRDSAARAMLRILAQLWREGIEIHKQALSEQATGQRIALPTYAFERKRYWIVEQRDPEVPASDSKDQERGAIAPAPVTTEDRLVEICRNLLDVRSIGPVENFFDLGGNSLFINRLRIRIREELGIEVSLQTLFEYPTVRGLSAQVDLLGRRHVA
jgi:phthiocerol/phenolphthiocerol synthesis type-I polyketide synthase E